MPPVPTARMRGVSPRRPRFPIPIRRAFTMPMGGALANPGGGVVGRVRPLARPLRRALGRPVVRLWVASRRSGGPLSRGTSTWFHLPPPRGALADPRLSERQAAWVPPCRNQRIAGQLRRARRRRLGAGRQKAVGSAASIARLRTCSGTAVTANKPLTRLRLRPTRRGCVFVGGRLFRRSEAEPC
jgi:hypothetical protein